MLAPRLFLFKDTKQIIPFFRILDVMEIQTPLPEDQYDVQACLNGDTHSFGPLVQRYQDRLLRLAHYLLGGWDDAEDAVQETFIKAYKKLETYDTERPFSSWLFKILVNTCKDRMKSAYWRKKIPLDTLIGTSRHETDTLHTLGNREILIRSFSDLTPKRRQALLLCDIEGFSTREAAQIMHCSESTVRVTLMHARRIIRKRYLEDAEE